MIRNQEVIIYSDIVEGELLNYFEMKKVKDIIDIVDSKGLLVYVKISSIQAKEAARLCKVLKIPFGDAAHLVLARDNGAIIVSRDRHLIEQDVVEARKPEDL